MAQRLFSRTGFCLWIAATIGAICVLPFVNAILPQSMQESLESHGLPFVTLMALSIGQSALLLGLMTFSGLWAARKLGMGAPALDAWFGGEALSFDLRRSVFTATTLGIVAGILLIAVLTCRFLCHWIQAALDTLCIFNPQCGWDSWLASAAESLRKSNFACSCFRFWRLASDSFAIFCFPFEIRRYRRRSSGPQTSSLLCSSVWGTYRLQQNSYL